MYFEHMALFYFYLIDLTKTKLFFLSRDVNCPISVFYVSFLLFC